MATLAKDNFNTYYQEKLWEMIPEVYRYEDGLETNPNPHVLRALVEIIAEQAAILRRSQDRLWEDQFIETCSDWAVPYIGDLLGTRLLSALNKRGRRVDVAKTIYNRRRKGTPAILEELIFDVSEWDGKLVEAFQRLIRARHALDPKPSAFAGRFTSTLPGGTADLRNAVGSELANGPFDEFFHTPDFRKPKGLDGRYGIQKLNFYLYRLFAYRVVDATAFIIPTGNPAVAPTEFMFDPSGRNIPLFSRRHRPDRNRWNDWHSAFEWELPMPIRCRLLGNAEYEVIHEAIESLPIDAAARTELRTLIGRRYINERRFIIALNELSVLSGLIAPPSTLIFELFRVFLAEDCGKNQLLPGSISVTADPPVGTVEKQLIAAADLFNWTTPANKMLAIDAERGRMLFNLSAPDAASNVKGTYYYGFSGPVGAGTYNRIEVEDSEPTLEIPATDTDIDPAGGPHPFAPDEIVQINDNRTYSLISDALGIKNLVFQAANQQRPYIVLQDHMIFASANAEATLVLDGLWFGGPENQQFDVVIIGDYAAVTIRNCTFDPGGSTNGNGNAIRHVRLLFEGVVDNLCIEKCILGPVLIGSSSILEEDMVIADSIVQSVASGVPAIEVSSGTLKLLRTTVFGSIDVHRLYASEVIITDTATVKDTQAGCFRFSTALHDPGIKESRLPRQYESPLFDHDSLHWFSSREFGQPGYAQLSETAPEYIYRGGEDGAEMGAFNSLLNSIKFDGIKTKIEEYMPFGLIPAFINQIQQPKP